MHRRCRGVALGASRPEGPHLVVNLRYVAAAFRLALFLSLELALRQKSFGCQTRNYLAAMPAVDPEILVSRENNGISKRFGHTNQARVGEAHRNV
jgi:hypothetical protein